MAADAIDSGRALATLGALVTASRALAGPAGDIMTTRLLTGTILDRILDRTAADLRRRASRTPLAELEHIAATMGAPASLKQSLHGPGIAVIAEIKRASPSRGTFPVTVDPPAVARAYLDGGAAAVSVLTDEPFFKGSLQDLAAAARIAHACQPPVPVLRKDFVIDDYQIVEARAQGADAVLLIVAALTDHQLTALMSRTALLGMDALVEVHDGAEMERAIAVGAAVVGINNRDLRTFEVDLGVSERLAALAPPGTTVVGESGIFTAADAARLAAAGVDAVLVGEGLILQKDRASAVRSLLAANE